MDARHAVKGNSRHDGRPRRIDRAGRRGGAGDSARRALDPTARGAVASRRAGRSSSSALAGGQTVYGVSTGVGNNSSRGVGTEEQVEYAVVDHGAARLRRRRAAVGGRRAAPSSSRGSSACRKGLSAVRLGLLESLCALLNHGIAPVIPRWGSVGASGDLTPLSYVAAVLAGRRKAYCEGRVVDAARALAAEGLEPFSFGPKEPLAIMNGTSVMTAVGILVVDRFERVIEQRGTTRRRWRPKCCSAGRRRSTPRVHEASRTRARSRAPRRHPATRCAAAGCSIRRTATGGRSRIATRSAAPRRWSARRATRSRGRSRCSQIELNSVNDNPLVDPATRRDPVRRQLLRRPSGAS